MKGGIILIVIGVLFLLREFGFIDMIRWGIVWPIGFIVVGLAMITRHSRYCVQCGLAHKGMCAPKQ